ncbi:nicotinate (nicotinamide) nucleotide adenylyltransferase [Polaromonas sp. JS666]|uniref:nicotinate (nicotinamide) nucleotide adenylyltransferase n=1 Tax=Polaromonas sp. (strain JS666 / ATCC BAA-500) TaxID=296591 RepID=UPI000885E649|nr:nicotinate (nicotinamide) nucleotide adenylyltransferase [Polaromonas sp. JS666]SDM40011.1 nicotinate-nucleotide adenylyltransferase [Polaromonas sp. JS666]
MSTQPLPPGRRIGVFGGAFDPPHNAHVALAGAAIAQFGLDTLFVVPTGHAWHKSQALSAPAHRLAMARLAFESIPHVQVDEREVQRPGPTFTIDTLLALQAENPGAQIYLFIGADQFAAFRQWHRWQDILDIAIICIAGRAQSMPAQPQFEAYESRSSRFTLLDLPLMPVSATQIRQLTASGAATAGEITRLVPEAVARYISLHQLYRSH